MPGEYQVRGLGTCTAKPEAISFAPTPLPTKLRRNLSVVDAALFSTRSFSKVDVSTAALDEELHGPGQC